MLRKKLQVFVSSTSDLAAERQAAIEAILTAGHIPAGMELFTAGDQSQMEVIRRWIEESDVYLLIRGGQYGSIEPHSGKSYIEHAYDFAVSLGKPLFECVVGKKAHEEQVQRYGPEVMEQESPARLESFRQNVTWVDSNNIKRVIQETLLDFAQRAEFPGWVRGDEPANAVAFAEEGARLAKEENEELRRLLLLNNSSKSKRDEQFALVLNWDGKTRFRGFDLSKQDLSGLDLHQADFINAILCEANLENVNLDGANLQRANLGGAKLRDANLGGAKLAGADLGGADLERANLERANLGGAKLVGADLEGAKLRRAKLRGANLGGADLGGADLGGAKLGRARYNRETRWPAGFDYRTSGAIGPHADLRDADLADADLEGADLEGASLEGANLEGVNLRRANLRRAKLGRARYNRETRWPAGFDYQTSGAIVEY